MSDSRRTTQLEQCQKKIESSLQEHTPQQEQQQKQRVDVASSQQDITIDIESPESRASSSLSMLAPKLSNISDIQWSMIDKKRYFPLTVTNMFAVRSLLYPLTLVRTRLQVQAGKSLYTGTFNALQTVIRYEGFLALYKGFWVNSFQLIPHVLYITSYEVISLFIEHFRCSMIFQ